MARRGRVAAGTRKAFDESKHKRAAGGRFGSKPATGAAPAQRQRGAVGAAHAIFEKLAGKPRSEVLAAAVAAGINRNTASTQLGAWQRARAARELAAAGGDTSKAARQAAAARALGVKPSTKPPAAPKAPKPAVPKPAPKDVGDRYTLRPGERPVAGFHRIADNMRDRPRAEVISTAVAAGVNRSTASVQYSAWARNQAARVPEAATAVAPAVVARVRGLSARTRGLLERRPGQPAATPKPSPTPVAATKAPAVDSQPRYKIQDLSKNIPKEGTKEREFHDQLVKAASVFPGARFNATYEDGKIVNFTVRTGMLGDDPKDLLRIDRVFLNGKVDHSYFKVPPGGRGNGAAKTFLAESVAAYKKAGYRAVKVHANIDVGGYAWLRYGFKPTGAGSNALTTHVHGQIDYHNKAVRESLNSDQLEAIRKMASEGKHAEIAAMTTPVKQQDGTTIPVGRALYLWSDWNGELSLKDGPAYDTFKRYAGVKS